LKVLDITVGTIKNRIGRKLFNWNMNCGFLIFSQNITFSSFLKEPEH